MNRGQPTMTGYPIQLIFHLAPGYVLILCTCNCVWRLSLDLYLQPTSCKQELLGLTLIWKSGT